MRQTRTARQGDSRGVAMIEFAITVPLLAVLVFGMIEAGFGFLDRNVLARATPQAARAASGEADGRYADYELLRSLDTTLSGLRASSIQRVIVFDATLDASVPTACLAQTRPDDLSVVGVPNTCNVYSASQVATDSLAAFAAPGCAGSWDANWCPADRTRDGNDPDRLGLWVELSFDRVSSFFPGALTMSDKAVFQLEPCVAGDPTC